MVYTVQLFSNAAAVSNSYTEINTEFTAAGITASVNEQFTHISAMKKAHNNEH